MTTLVPIEIDDAALHALLDETARTLSAEDLGSGEGARREAQVVITRNRPDDWADRPIHVWLDDEPIGSVRYGTALARSIVPGRHRVRVHNTLFGRTLEFHAAPGEQVRLRCANQTARGGLLMMLMMGVALLRVSLEREEPGP